MIRRRCALAFLCLALLPHVAAAVVDPPFERSNSAFMRHDFTGAESAAREVLRVDTIASHRLGAALMLGNIAWRVRRDNAAATRWLAEADAMPTGHARAAVERARMLFAAGKFGDAEQASRDAIAATPDSAQRRPALVELARALAEPRLRARLATDASAGRSVDVAALGPAILELSALVRDAPGELDAARLLVTLGALANDGAAMQLGWHSYYFVGGTDAPNGVLTDPRHVLDARLPQWTESAPIAPADREMIVGALAGSRFFDAAAIIATGAASRSARLNDVMRYARFLRATELATNEYYRATANKQGRPKQWQRALDGQFRGLWRDLSWPGKRPRYTRDAAEQEIDRRFGAVVNLGSTAGYDDLHMGHRVIDDRRSVKQYGHGADVRFVALDAMVSNGFQSWAWDGHAAHGGWGGGAIITQVRPSYANGPLRAWHVLSDSVTHRESVAAERADSVTDIARARSTPIAYFSGLSQRLERQGREEILDSLRAKGLSGRALKAEFITVYDAQVRESSIFAHEGRHVIDGSLGKFSDEELEFRAKLSEIVFAPNPRLAMGAIMSDDMGVETPHGRASGRVLRGLVEWMTTHADQIRSFDPASPTLPQMTLLTDAQMRDAFTSMDPMAPRAGAAAPQ